MLVHSKHSPVKLLVTIVRKVNIPVLQVQYNVPIVRLVMLTMMWLKPRVPFVLWGSTNQTRVRRLGWTVIKASSLPIQVSLNALLVLLVSTARLDSSLLVPFVFLVHSKTKPMLLHQSVVLLVHLNLLVVNLTAFYVYLGAMLKTSVLLLVMLVQLALGPAQVPVSASIVLQELIPVQAALFALTVLSVPILHLALQLVLHVMRVSTLVQMAVLQYVNLVPQVMFNH
jgi:hypothetical protein